MSADNHIDPETPAPTPRRAPWWIAIAAAIVAVAVAIPLAVTSRKPTLARLATMAPRSERIVEPRLSGGFAWAPYRGTEPATGTANLKRVQLAGAAVEAVERAELDRSIEAQHVAGVAMVLAEQPLEAIERLRGAARAAGDADTWSDLAAAQYAAALSLGRA